MLRALLRSVHVLLAHVPAVIVPNRRSKKTLSPTRRYAIAMPIPRTVLAPQANALALNAQRLRRRRWRTLTRQLVNVVGTKLLLLALVLRANVLTAAALSKTVLVPLGMFLLWGAVPGHSTPHNRSR